MAIHKIPLVEIPAIETGVTARVARHRISAIQVMTTNEHDQVALGPITQLPQQAQVEVQGAGFNARTVKVYWNGCYYFVFREDLELPTAV